MTTFPLRSLIICISALVFLTSCTDEPEDAVSPTAPTQTTSPTVSSQENPPAEARAFACEPRDLTFDQGAIDLTGAWSADDSGVYYLRQIGNDLWWQGMDGVGGPEASLGKEFDNVLHGTIGHDLLIEADWADVPRGVILGKGTLTLQVVEGNDGMAEIRKFAETGTGFGGGVWTPCTPTSPKNPPAEARAFACEARDLTFDQGAIDLTGAWSAVDSVFYLRQIGNDLWWQGMDVVGGPEASLGKVFDNVLHGTIGHDRLIEADWADVPRGAILGKGTLTLRVVKGNDGMAKIHTLDETRTGFGAEVWTPCTPTSP